MILGSPGCSTGHGSISQLTYSCQVWIKILAEILRIVMEVWTVVRPTLRLGCGAHAAID